MEDAARILVIDDEIGMREGSRRALVPHGFQVKTAEHGVEGLRKLREGDFDLVLVDAMMPGMSGLEFLDRIRQEAPDVVSVMITGYATVDLAAEAMKQGAYDFLPKPFTSDELLNVVHRALDAKRRKVEERQRAQEEEEQAQLARTRHEQAKFDAIESRFMLTVVHELRNPAGVIKNYLQLLRGGYVDEAEWDEYLAKLEDRAGQLIEMLDDLLELAHLKARQTETGRLEPVDAADVLKKVAARFRPRAEAAGLEFRIDIAGRPTLPARPAHLESLWAHLIDNAVRYTNQGRVIVSLDQIPGQLITCVADTGIGMSTESLTRIFEEFYRGEQARETVEVGTGLGLPIVHQIVRLYDGSVEVDTAPGEGSRFTVSLPLHE